MKNGRRPSLGWVKQIARWLWAHRLTTRARLDAAVEKVRRAESRKMLLGLRPSAGVTDARPVEVPNSDVSSLSEHSVFAPGYGLDDLETHMRMSDQRYVVQYRFGPQIGVISPSKGRFAALHIRNGEVGPFDSLEEARRALWELD
jgi:hypothetical protein